MNSEDIQDLDRYVCEQLAPHRDGLERLAELDTELSEDAQTALQLLDERSQKSEDGE